jgi:hypothetical protein
MAHGWELNEVSDTRNGGLYILGILHMHELITVLRSGKDTKKQGIMLHDTYSEKQ